MPKKLPGLYSHKLFTLTYIYIFTDISAISVTFCNSVSSWDDSTLPWCCFVFDLCVGLFTATELAGLCTFSRPGWDLGWVSTEHSKDWSAPGKQLLPIQKMNSKNPQIYQKRCWNISVDSKFTNIQSRVEILSSPNLHVLINYDSPPLVPRAWSH